MNVQRFLYAPILPFSGGMPVVAVQLTQLQDHIHGIRASFRYFSETAGEMIGTEILAPAVSCETRSWNLRGRLGAGLIKQLIGVNENIYSSLK